MRKTSKFSPHLEGLSDRAVPAVMSTFQDGILTIAPAAGSSTGGDQVLIAVVNNQVLVFNNGNLDVFQNADALWKIDATTGSGDDNVVTYFGDSFKAGDSVTLNVNTGEGNDKVQVRANGIGTGGYLATNIDTGAGNDEVRENLGRLLRGATVDTNVTLGEGDDLFRWVGGEVRRDSRVTIIADTGAGADTIDLKAGDLRRDVNFFTSLDLGDDTAVDTVNLSSFAMGKGTFANFNIAGATTTGSTGVDVIDQEFLNSDAMVRVNGVLTTFEEDDGGTITIHPGTSTGTDNGGSGTDDSDDSDDDNGGGNEPGDDNGGNGNEPGDDNGGNTSGGNDDNVDQNR